MSERLREFAQFVEDIVKAQPEHMGLVKRLAKAGQEKVRYKKQQDHLDPLEDDLEIQVYRLAVIHDLELPFAEQILPREPRPANIDNLADRFGAAVPGISDDIHRKFLIDSFAEHEQNLGGYAFYFIHPYFQRLEAALSLEGGTSLTNAGTLQTVPNRDMMSGERPPRSIIEWVHDELRPFLVEHRQEAVNAWERWLAGHKERRATHAESSDFPLPLPINRDQSTDEQVVVLLAVHDEGRDSREQIIESQDAAYWVLRSRVKEMTGTLLPRLIAILNSVQANGLINIPQVRRLGSKWSLRFRMEHEEVKACDFSGLEIVEKLVAQAGREIHLAKLVDTETARLICVSESSQEVLDKKGDAVLRARLQELMADKDKASCPTEVAEIEAEMKKVNDELSNAFTRGGRKKKLGKSHFDRVWEAVIKKLRRLPRQLEKENMPVLAGHFKDTISWESGKIVYRPLAQTQS